MLPAFLVLALAVTQSGTWDFVKCRQSIADGKAEPGHQCQQAHLEADLALLRSAPRMLPMTLQQEREVAETGAAQALVDAQKAMADLEESQREEEERVAALDPQFKGSGLLSACESFLRLSAIQGGSQAAPRRDSFKEWSDLSYDTGLCMGFVTGVFDSLTQNMAAGPVLLKKSMHTIVCAPAGVTYDQAIRVVLKFLQDHPERLHERRYTLVRDALWRAFPCPKDF